jgi:hypothetical protein
MALLHLDPALGPVAPEPSRRDSWHPPAGCGMLDYLAFPALCFNRAISSSTSYCVRMPFRSSTATNAAIS